MMRRGSRCLCGLVDMLSNPLVNTFNGMSGGGAMPGGGGDNEEEEVKQIVRNVCEMELYKDRRVTKLDIDDLLGLLAEFNKRGVHFC